MFKQNKFTTENEAIAFLKKRCIDNEVMWSFEPIVASGKHGKTPHYVPKKKSKLLKGFCIIDFGVEYKGYCSDMTRTIYLGEPSQKEITYYEEILQGLKKSEKEAKKGAKLKVPFKMIHALGHGIGLHVHEAPNLHADTLLEGMTIALEPATYDPYGVRIEDNYLIQKEKSKRLSRLTRDLQIISLKSGKR
jgi:Xaa-Pro dipeptidase